MSTPLVLAALDRRDLDRRLRAAVAVLEAIVARCNAERRDMTPAETTLCAEIRLSVEALTEAIAIRAVLDYADRQGVDIEAVASGKVAVVADPPQGDRCRPTPQVTPAVAGAVATGNVSQGEHHGQDGSG